MDCVLKRLFWRVRCRHALVVITFLGLANLYLLRVNLNLTIVKMVAKSNSSDESPTDSCPQESEPTETAPSTTNGEFDWTTQDQGFILGALYYGYAAGNFVGGLFSEKFGGKNTFGIGILGTAVLTLFTPLAAQTSKYALIALRVCEGLFEGIVFPALHTICGRWLPKGERNFLYGIMYSGTDFGTIIGFPIAGCLSSTTFLGGWPAVFYIFGAVGVIWCIFWWLLIYDHPSEHPRIDPEEKAYILQNLEQTEAKGVAPWGKILTSIPVWTTAIAAFGSSYSFYFVFNDLSSFLSTMLHYKIETNGFLSCLPYISSILLQSVGGLLADHIVAKKWVGLTNTRKGFFLFGSLLTVGCFLGAIFAGCQKALLIACIVVGTAARGIMLPAVKVSLLDMTPDYAGTIMGFTNAFGGLAGVVAPLVVGILTDKNNTMAQWHTAFYISMGVSFVSAVIFTFFSSSELQPWGRGKLEVEETRQIPKRYGTIPGKYFKNKSSKRQLYRVDTEASQ